MQAKDLHGAFRQTKYRILSFSDYRFEAFGAAIGKMASFYKTGSTGQLHIITTPATQSGELDYMELFASTTGNIEIKVRQSRLASHVLR